MNKVYLPDYLEDFANSFARDYVEEIKGIDPDNKGYNKAIERALQSFCNDYYESLTGIESNPTSAKAREAFETFFPVLFKPELLGNKITSKEHAQLIQQRLKSSIMHLVHTYMIVVAGIKPQDTQFKPGTVHSEAEKIHIATARITRSILVMIFLSVAMGAFRINPDSLKVLVKKIIENNGITKINTKEFRNALAKETLTVLKNEINKLKIISPLWDAMKTKVLI